MNLRCDKVIRVIAPGIKRVYSICLTDDAAYLIQTGKVGALNHYRRDSGTSHVVAIPDNRDVRELQANESRIDMTSLDELVKIRDNYLVRLEAIEEVELKSSKNGPEMWLVVTGSEHHLFFPLATWDEVQTLQRALSKWAK
jgi:hypothetical protein